MLRNESKEAIPLRWNGKTVVIKPGDSLSVEKEFGADSRQVVFLEDRFMGKNPGAIVKYETGTGAAKPEEKPTAKPEANKGEAGGETDKETGKPAAPAKDKDGKNKGK
jgi:hypothetical protein